MLPRPKGCPPAYGGCMCHCHTMSGVMHCVPCCRPDANNCHHGWVGPDCVLCDRDALRQRAKAAERRIEESRYWAEHCGRVHCTKPRDDGRPTNVVGKEAQAMTTATDYSDLSDADLSRLVARRVMGWLPDVDGWVAHKTARVAEWDHDFDITDPAAYMAIVDAMGARGWWCVIKSPFAPSEPWMAGFTPHDITGWNGRADYSHQDACPGRAIAIAALMAMDGA